MVSANGFGNRKSRLLSGNSLMNRRILLFRRHLSLSGGPPICCGDDTCHWSDVDRRNLVIKRWEIFESRPKVFGGGWGPRRGGLPMIVSE